MKKQYSQLRHILFHNSFQTRFFWALFICLVLTLPLLLLGLWHQDHEQQKLFETELVKKQIQIVFDDNERSRINRDYGKLAKEIWRLSAFEEIVLFDKTSDCKILAQIPLNGKQISCNDSNKLNVNDEFSDLGKISFIKKERPVFLGTESILATLTSLAIFIITFSLLLTYLLKKLLLNPFKNLQEDIIKLKDTDSNIGDDTLYPQELLEIKKTINSTRYDLRLAQEQIKEQSRKAVLGEIASQVAHDIRSPLAALDTTLREIAQFPEQTRYVVRSSISRIHDILNNLLVSYRSLNVTTEQELSKEETILLSSAIESIVSEKRIQYRSRLGLNINFELGKESYGLFSKINPVEFKRALSNIINNAVEAIPTSGEVTILLAAGDQGMVQIKVIDTGKGISSELIEKLGQKGQTFGKEHGSGLGLFHAKTTFESWKGSLTVQSTLGKGTEITITLPKTPPPSWFVEKINIPEGSRVVVIDDDSSIHHIWDGRFQSARFEEQNIEVIHLSTPELAQEWFKENALSKETLFLIDYEFLGSALNGLELIQKLQIEKNSYLVTSRYEEGHILEKCSQHGIHLIPKNLAGFIPVGTNKKETAPAVLLDDDEITRISWESAAKRKGIPLTTYASASELFSNLHHYPKETTFYIDTELGENQKNGKEITKELYEKGYRNLYIETGHEPEVFKDTYWIKGVLGKRPNFC